MKKIILAFVSLLVLNLSASFADYKELVAKLKAEHKAQTEKLKAAHKAKFAEEYEKKLKLLSLEMTKQTESFQASLKKLNSERDVKNKEIRELFRQSLAKLGAGSKTNSQGRMEVIRLGPGGEFPANIKAEIEVLVLKYNAALSSITGPYEAASKNLKDSYKAGGNTKLGSVLVEERNKFYAFTSAEHKKLMEAQQAEMAKLAADNEAEHKKMEADNKAEAEKNKAAKAASQKKCSEAHGARIETIKKFLAKHNQKYPLSTTVFKDKPKEWREEYEKICKDASKIANDVCKSADEKIK